MEGGNETTNYLPPSWASHLNPIPSTFYSLGHFPTPIHKWNLPNLPKGTQVWLKRDDLSGGQVGGNKIRKLEFLLADAIAQGSDCIVTIGGTQSNCCCAAALSAKLLNLDAYPILLTPKALVDKDPGLTGNLLIQRMVGAHIHLYPWEEFLEKGSSEALNMLKEKLISEGRKPYVIRDGGSNSLGIWGYIEAIREIELQVQNVGDQVKFDDIVVACGSGGTVAGLSIGSWLSSLKAKVHAFSVCYDSSNCYDDIQDLLDRIHAGVSAHDIVNIQEAKGLGYSLNTTEELQFFKQIAEATGVILDPVYSGKAAYGMMKDMAENPTKWEGRKILFIHTGGLLAWFAKTEKMEPLVVGKLRQMDINDSIPVKDGIGNTF